MHFDPFFKAFMVKKSYPLVSITFITVSSLCASNLLADPVPKLQSTTVSAPRFMDADMQVASRVQLIDAEAIAASGSTDMVQLLQKVGNIHFQSYSGNSAQSEISMGGFGENSAQRVLILLDGQRLNTADLARFNWLSIPLGLVDSVEIIQGGQAALYGTNAVGGVIKIQTRRPTETLSGQIQGSVGSFDSYNGRFALTGREGGLGFAIHAARDETDGFRENSQYEADAAGLKLEWMGSNWFSAYGSVNAVSSEYGLPGPLTRAELDDDYNQSTEADNHGSEEVIYYRAGAAFCIGDLWTFAIDAGQTDRQFDTQFFDPFVFMVEQDYDVTSLSPTLTYEDERLSAVVGLDFNDDSVDVISASSFGTSNYRFERETIAAFTSFSWSVGDDSVLTGTGRAEQTTTKGFLSGNGTGGIDEDQFAWSIGAIRFIGNHSRIYGTARRFFRYPATDEIIDVFSGAAPLVNFDLQPEKGHELEFGSDITNGALTLGGRFFYQWMEDEIIYDGNIGLFGSNVNVGQTERLGLDLRAGYVLTENLDIALSYAWVRARFSNGSYEGNEIPLAPEHKLRLQFTYRPRDIITLVAGAAYTHDIYVGGDFSNSFDRLDDYLLFDLSARVELSDGVEAFASVDNIFDKEYVSTAFGTGLYPGAGRSARLGLLWRF